MSRAALSHEALPGVTKRTAVQGSGDLAKPLRGCDLAESLVHLPDPAVLQVRRLAVPAIQQQSHEQSPAIQQSLAI